MSDDWGILSTCFGNKFPCCRDLRSQDQAREEQRRVGKLEERRKVSRKEDGRGKSGIEWENRTKKSTLARIKRKELRKEC